MGIDIEVLYKLKSGEKPGRERDWGERMHLMECDPGLVAVHRMVTAKKKDFLVVGKKRWSDVDKIEEFYVHEKLGLVATRGKTGKQQHVVVSDEEGPGFDAIDDFFFTVDGTPITTGTSKKKGTTIVRGDEEIGPFPYAGSVMASPDGKHLAWIVAEGGKRGKYGGMAGGKWWVVVDGEKRSEAFDHVTVVNWSDDGKLAYVANTGGMTDGIYDAEGGEWFAVIDGTRYGPYENINRVHGIGFDGPHWSFLAREGGKEVAVFDGKKTEPHESISAACWVEGKTFYQADQKLFVIDGKRIEVNGTSSSFMFGKGGRFAFVEDSGDRRCVVCDGKRGPEFGTGLHTVPIFSPDGSRLAYFGKEGDKCFVDLDGQRLGTAYDNLAWGHAFSPDGKRFAFSVYHEGQQHWIVDGEHLPATDGDTSDLVFTEDGSHFVLAQPMGKGKKKEGTVFVDGKPIQGFTWVEQLQWAPREKCFAALAQQGESMLLLRITP